MSRFKVKMSPFIKKINELAHAVKANSIVGLFDEEISNL